MSVKQMPDMSSTRTFTLRLQPKTPYRRQILVIGQTGHGKTTFVNALFNFFYGRNPSNFIYICDFPRGNFKNFGENTLDLNRNSLLDTEKEEFKRRVELGEGLTENCYKYTCRDEFVIYDTPGLSDGKGTEQDDKNIECILKEASTAGYLNAIIYVINSSTARLDPAIKNSINRLASMIPNKFANSVLVVHSFCSNGRSKVNDAWLPFTARKKFFIDTDLFDFSKEDFQEQIEHISQTWEQCKKVLTDVKAEIDNMNAECVEEYQFLYNEHNRAKSRYSELKVDVKTLLKLKKAFKQSETLCNDYSNFYRDNEVTITEMISTNYHNTLCMLCNSLCHEECNLKIIIERGSIKFNDCACMTSSKLCKICSCDHKQHYHEHKIPVEITKTIKVLMQNLRDSLETQNYPQEIQIDEVQRVKLEITRQEADIKRIEDEINKKKLDLMTTAIMMKKVCPKFSMRKQIHLEIDFINKIIHQNDNISYEEIEELEEWKNFLGTLHEMMRDKFQEEVSLK